MREGELDRGAQQRGPHTVPAGAWGHGEAGDPPRAGIWVKQASQRAVTADASESIARPDPRPSNRLVPDVPDQTGRNTGVGYLAVERGTVIPSLRRQVHLLRRRLKETSTPIPRRIMTSAAEHGHNVVPSAHRQRQDLELGHDIEPSHRQ
jgi:hypothetical protein